MKQTSLLAGSLLCIGMLFLLTCGDNPYIPRTGAGAPHAFVCDSIIANPSVQDTSLFSKCDTVHTGDTLTFFGAVIPYDTRVIGAQWNFGEGTTNDSQAIVKHAYGKGGLFTAVFSVFDSVGNYLSDSVSIVVNTPPDSISILAPSDGAMKQPLIPHLAWKGFDRDFFDSSLVYMVIFVLENGTADTIIRWYDTTSIDLNIGFGNEQKISWFVLAKDRFGEVAKSDTFHFTTIGSHDATLLRLQPSSGSLVPAFSSRDTVYLDTVEHTTSVVTITAVPKERHARVSINQTAIDTADSSASVPLATGTTCVPVKVTAPDELATKTYWVCLTRLPDPNSLLYSLKVSSGNLVRDTTPLPDSLWDTVSYATSSITLTPFTLDGRTAVVIGSKTVKSGNSCAPISLGVGKTAIPVKVTSEDGKTKKTYIVTIVRLPNFGFSLSSLLISKGTLTQISAPIPDTLRDTVSFLDSTITLTPAVGDTQAAITINAAAIKSNTASQPMMLAVGTNKIIIMVKGPEGTSSKTYVLLVVRKPESSKPVIKSQPHDTAVVIGSDLAIFVTYTSSPVVVQWRKNGIDLPQATSDTLRFSVVQITDAGIYSVKLRNQFDSATSTQFRLRILPKIPANLSAQARSAISIGLSWSQAEGASWYRLLRASGNGGFASICTTSQLEYIDTPLTQSNSYIYRIRGGNSDGESDTSKPISVFTVTFDGQDATTPANPTSKKVISPATSVISLPTPPGKAGFIFGGWFTQPNGGGAAFTASSTVTSSVTVYAKWSINAYTVTFDDQGASTPPNPSSKTIELPATTIDALPTPPLKTGYTFGGWFTQPGGAGTEFTQSSAVGATITVYAKWNTYSYGVTFDGQNATTQAIPSIKTVASPATTIDALPTPPTKAGYTFGGWFTQPNGAGAAFSATSAINANITVYAKWNTYSYIISFDGQNATLPASPSIKTVASPATTIDALPTPPTKTGYIFGGWFTQPNGGGAAYTASSIVTANDTVYAKWNTNAFTVTFDDQSANVHPSPTSKTITSPATTIDALPTPPGKTGYIFGGWFTLPNGAGAEFTASSAVTGSITVYAKWNSYSYIITFDGQNATTPASPTVKTVSSPNTAIDALPTPPARTGYIFGGWFTQTNGGGVAFTASTAVTGSITVYAKWNTNAYTVTFDDQGATSSVNPTSKTVTSPATTIDALPTPPAKTGYIFGGWFTEQNGAGTEFTAISIVTASITVYAKWNTYAYIVTFDGQTATTPPSPSSIYVLSPATTVGSLPTAPTKTGYNFGGWFTQTNGNGTAFTASSVVTGNITVYAKWNTNAYTVTFDDQGATTLVSPTNKTVTSPATTIDALPTPPAKTGYIFGGWFTETNGAGTEFTANSNVITSLTVYAKWNTYSYSVTFDGQNATTPASPNVINVNSPDTIVGTLPVPPTKTGYNFGGWFTQSSGNGTAFTASSVVTGNITVYAKWNSNSTFTVTFDGQGATTQPNPSSKTVVSPATTVVTLPTQPTKTGYIFGGWFTQPSGAGAQFTATTIVTASITVYAKWNTYSYTVTFDGQGATTLPSPTIKTVTSPATTVVTLPTSPNKTGSIFAGWYTQTNGNGTQFTATTVVTANITVYAKWNSNTYYTVTFDDQNATTPVSPTTIPVAPAAAIGSLPASPLKTGYIFGGWFTLQNGAGAEFTASSIVNANITVYAKWNSYSYTVTFDGQNATTPPSPSSMNVVSPATTVGSLPTPPTKTGYVFGGWNTQPNGAGSQFTGSTAVTASITVYAQWNTNSFTVTFDDQSATTPPSPSSMNVVSPAITVGSLPTPPTKTGYVFGGWFTQINGAGSQFTENTVVSAGITVYAKWNSYSYTVSFDGQNATTPASPSIKTVASPATAIDALPNPPAKTGYNFGGWFTQINGSGTAFTASTVVTGSISVYAKWNTNEFTVTFDDQGATTAPNPTNTTVISPATTVGTLPTAPLKTGYIFGGWFTQLNGAGEEFTATSAVTASITVYAKWNSYSYSVTFDGQGASTPASPSIKTVISPATTIGVLPTPPLKTQYSFGGWFTLQNGLGDPFTAATTVTTSTTVFAKWIPDVYTITFDDQAASTPVSPNSMTVTVPATSLGSLPTPPAKAGYSFDGWFSQQNGLGDPFTGATAVNASTTVYAKWIPDVYTITFDDQAATTPVSPNSMTVTVPATSLGALPTPPAKAGYSFDGWFSQQNGLGDPFTGATPVIASTTVYAKWIPDVYTITFDDQTATTPVAPNSMTVTVPATSLGSLPTPPAKTGYSFGGWFSQQNGLGDPFTAATAVNASTTVFAKWNPDVYTVTFDDQAASTPVNPSSMTVTVPATNIGSLPTDPVKTQYIFGGWFTQINGGGTQFTASTIVTSSITVYALWIPPYTITFNDQSATTPVNPTSMIVTYPATTLGSLPTPPERTGYTFGGWFTEINGGGINITESTVISSDATVYAKWIPYTVSFDDQGASTPVSPTSIEIIYPATTVGTLPTEPAKDGYQFGGWFTLPNGGGDAFTVSTEVTASITVYAFWQ
jgi:uncharacterized repeat protein (TIGR02543 family)